MRLPIIVAMTLFVLSVLCVTHPWIVTVVLACSSVIAVAFAPWSSMVGPSRASESGEGANDGLPVSLTRSATEFERECERAADVRAAARRTDHAATNGSAAIDLVV